MTSETNAPSAAADTTTVPLGQTTEYSWTKPAAWDSERLYPFDKTNGDADLMDLSDDIMSYFKCDNVKLNGKVGAAFFNRRYYSINICNNGVMAFNLEWRLHYPNMFESSSFFQNIAIIAPFWAQVDERLMSSLKNEWTDAGTKVFYQAYEYQPKMDDNTRMVIDKANQDVEDSAAEVADFKATWVLVVTWINIAPTTSCNRFMESMLCKEEAEKAALNHFQAVFITDGTYSFVKFNYPAGGINWAVPDVYEQMGQFSEAATNLPGKALAGLNSGDASTGAEVITEYVAGSNRLDMMYIDQVNGNLKDGREGEWLFRVESSSGVVTASAECNAWVVAEMEFLDTYEEFSVAVPCPQNLGQMQRDPSFDFISSIEDESECYQSRFEEASFAGLRQKCCYSINSATHSALIFGAPYGGHVTNTNQPDAEQEGYDKCCAEGVDMCSYFYKVRHPSDGTGYSPPSIRPLFGDPHIVTSDGSSYTFNGLGEYLFTQIGTDDVIIQARTERVVTEDGGLGQATYFSAISISSSGLPTVQTQINKNNTLSGIENQLQLIINGTEEDISLIEQDSNSTQTLDGVSSNILFKRTNASLTILFSTGVSVTVSVTMKMMTITLGLPSKYKGRTVGLTGAYDDDQMNDLMWLNGSSYISINSTESEVFEWASTFAVSEEDSLMYYTDGADWFTYNNNSFVPVFTDDIDNWVWSTEEFKNRAYNVCETNTACLYDVFVTGDISIGESSKQTEESSAADNAALNNFAPTIYGLNSVFIVVGEEFEYTVNVSDPNEDEVAVTTNIQTTISSDSDGILTITGTVTNATGFTLLVSAQDPAGAVSVKTPLAMLCSCANGGTCVELSTADQQDVETSSILLDCVCPTGYTGSMCETDLDACALVASPCYPSVPCVDSPAPADHTGYVCGDCPAGYTGDGKTCSDIDECQENSCDHICINFPGSFVCACRTGYELNVDGETCDDVDECLTMPCHHICNNTVGDFHCQCYDSFELTGDGMNCEPANPCVIPSPCDDVNGYCNVAGDVQECSCKRGYTLNAVNESRCDEIDECLLGIDACAQNCSNTVGGYTCSCQAGYTLAFDRMGCNDDNECVLGTYSCHMSQICSNTLGGYECACASGEVLKDGQCYAIDFAARVENVTETPVMEAEDNSIVFSLTGMRLNEYTVMKEIQLFTILAESATSLCSDSNCDFIAVASDARRRKRAATTTFYKEHFSRLPGYPQYDDNGDLQLAIYTLVPGTGVLSSQRLEQAIVEASADIASDLGVDVFLLRNGPSDGTSTDRPSDVTEKVSYVIVYASVGCVLAIVLVVIVVAVVVIKVKTRPAQKAVSPVPDVLVSDKYIPPNLYDSPKREPPTLVIPVVVSPAVVTASADNSLIGGKQLQAHPSRLPPLNIESSSPTSGSGMPDVI